MRKTKRTVPRANAKQSKRRPGKESAPHSVPRPIPIVKRLWVVAAPIIHARVFADETQARDFAARLGLPVISYVLDHVTKDRDKMRVELTNAEAEITRLQEAHDHYQNACEAASADTHPSWVESAKRDGAEVKRLRALLAELAAAHRRAAHVFEVEGVAK